MNENKTIPTVLITGASGFIGSHLVRFLSPNHRVIAFARRTQKEVGLEAHPNIHWILVDITDEQKFETAFNKANDETNIDFIFHLAAYYDFGDQVPSEIYEKTNVQSTRQLLELARSARIKRFIFTSSLVASNFPEPGDLVYEESDLDATFPYALTKQSGEILVREASEHFPCTVIRLAAVFGDWCEYEPLYHFLKVWLSDRWDSRILPGKGNMAIPYIQVCCVVNLFTKVLEKSDELGAFNLYLASSDKPFSLLELFTLSTRHFYGHAKTPIFIPSYIARFGVLMRDIWGRLIGKRPFERMWMLDYIDKQFPTDCSYTRNQLDWSPTKRHQLSRRLLFLIENLKSRPDEWHTRNINRLKRFERSRPALALAEEMARMHEEMSQEIFSEITKPENSKRYTYYQNMDPADLRWYIDVVYNNLLSSVRHGDRSIMVTFAQDLSLRRIQEHCTLKELCDALSVTRDIIMRGLYDNPNLQSMKLLVHDYITLAIQLAMDEIKDVYENVPR
ncbi:MAG: NAD(P)-dependent oxidoreductase [Candidatus Marinimicrobia bacterium]|jgi:nucleoside-diphosphate-sugar epimerase|nr:NAD(P)-dependent oxidoreductase [Candidatus Neomarinimicrobiota bacterium]MBT3630755.1 NAD(P)-dependent oxidoreductase [Candidatus Neomarinimicrobiota bacterium]MBT3823892.1 NAD(P)-dependent oxidoreductase [Candidatus Neomarinimicrobiota bacterium]MBT4130309.1 NAD(P)-dependent oxidoreductase [Candidatus Neomarinimicrobiota bacterium]MBT4295142.1 NAD(P)-dependent oxidoreductase [Candidatus Neomarinimicrobiota bacterium]